jgi:hypothetical protein|tara:strand:- start:2497 stop:2754 length:258 start_codon:yes stop_codon:yes gene_type:complete
MLAKDDQIPKNQAQQNNLKKDPINPSYYTKGIEVTKFAQSHGLSFAEGNIIKYIVRHKFKNGLEDLKKAEKYLQLLKEKYMEKTE